MKPNLITEVRELVEKRLDEMPLFGTIACPKCGKEIKNLVLCPINNFTETLEFGED
jgi:hypothetical protein